MVPLVLVLGRDQALFGEVGCFFIALLFPHDPTLQELGTCATALLA
jgi:hypothetical protein